MEKRVTLRIQKSLGQLVEKNDLSYYIPRGYISTKTDSGCSGVMVRFDWIDRAYEYTPYLWLLVDDNVKILCCKRFRSPHYTDRVGDLISVDLISIATIRGIFRQSVMLILIGRLKQLYMKT